jgi:hypothetical protein
MSSASDRKFTLPSIISGIHRFFAAVFGGFISFLWRNSRYVPLRIRLSIGYVALGAIAYWVMGFFPEGFISWASFDEAQIRLLQKSGEYASSLRLDLYAKITIGACILAAVFSFIKFKISYYILEAALSIWALLALAVLRFAFSAPAQMCASDYKIFDKLSRNAIWTASLGFGSVVAILFVMMLLALSLSTVRRSFSIGKEVSFGDKVVVSLISGGSDPRYRTSWYWAVGIFVFIIVAPFIFRGCGWEDPYGLVKGSGQPEVQVVKVKKIKREKKKKYILNKWSPYILERAKLDDVKTFEDMLEQTQDTYVADQPKKSGKLGKGGGKTGGWPKGMEGAKVRFIRLEYAGGDWNQDMGKGSDYNLLIRFHQITGFPIAHETESRPISRLGMFPKHYAPPFVFMTGSRSINLSSSDIKSLRKYLVDEGGMLFIDNGGGYFGHAVRNMLSKVLPGKPLIDIPNDDPIYRQPYIFPDGAPPFWHHDGTRARGVRLGDRLAVFYHPGDINDAWKDGHSGASSQVAEQAYRIGINVMYYAFNAYYAKHFGEGESNESK